MKKNTVTVTWKRDWSMNKGVYLIFIPIIVYFIIFNYLPMFGIVMAFEDFNAVRGFLGSKWVGFANFMQFFTGPNFLRILRNTMVISFMGLAFSFPLSIIFALLLNEIFYVPFKKMVQTISYMPYFVSAVVMCGLVIDFVSNNGIITNILVAFGLPRQNLLTNPKYFWLIYTLSGVWQGLGYGSIVFIASITGVSQELHEAAAIDGANRLSRVWHVTLPAMIPTIVTMLILQIGLVLQVGSDKILLLYNPSVYETADVISTHVYRMGIERMQYSYSAAVGLFNSVVGTLMLLGSNALSRKLAGSSIF
ncbi:MAG: ABC transporter permease subunit [Spirochaetaceae bacterium]|jgi:putative aldouronate transport system permease protein|nr:ABC transporter permease subunit [Spirochaetaceae bacterium]